MDPGAQPQGEAEHVPGPLLELNALREAAKAILAAEEKASSLGKSFGTQGV